MTYKWLVSLLLLGISIANLKSLTAIYINYMTARAEARNFHHFLGKYISKGYFEFMTICLHPTAEPGMSGISKSEKKQTIEALN